MSIIDRISALENRVTVLENHERGEKQPDKPAKIERHYPFNLSEDQRAAIECALEGIEKPFTMGKLVETAVALDPDVTFHGGGETYNSIRYFICELAGMKITWANKKRKL